MAIIAAIMVSAASSVAAGDDLRGASSGSHLWLALDPRGQSTASELAHHPADEAAWQFRTQHSMTQTPAAMAAWSDEVWLVNPPRTTASGYKREVYSAKVQLNAATGLYFITPIGRLEMEPPLEGLGRLAGFVATRKGPIALLVPSPRVGPALKSGEAPNPRSALKQPMLLRLQPGDPEWSEIPLPEGFLGTRDGRIGLAGDELVLMDASPDRPGWCQVYFQRGEGWEPETFMLDVRDVRSLISVAGQCVAAIEDAQTKTVGLSYVRPAGPLPLTSVPTPDGTWMICGFNNQILIVDRERGEGEPLLNVTRIDPLTGSVSTILPMRRQPMTAGRLWPIALALGLSLSAVLVAVLLRPPPSESIPVAPARVLVPARRISAACIDLAVGALPAMLLLDCAPADLLAIPMLSGDFGQSGPYMGMVVIASVVATALEALFGRSVGKTLVHARVTNLLGERVSWWRIILRGVIRLLVYLIPPLGAFVLTNSHMQGLPDMAARTLVLADESIKLGDETENP